MQSRPEMKDSFAAALRYERSYVERCEGALDEALRSTSAYRAWAALDPGSAHSVFSRLAALPALTKRDLRAHGPQGFVPGGGDVMAGVEAGEIELVTTSGSTGDRVTNIWHQPWWNESEAASWRLNAHARAAAVGEHREAILTSPWCTGFPCEEGYLAMKERTLDRFLYLSERSDPSTWTADLMDRMVRELEAFEPLVIEANPSFLARLAHHVVRRGMRVHSPALIILTYENPSLLHRRWISRAFGAPIASSYGSTEAGYVFMECEAGRLHQVTESCHVDYLPFAPEHGGPAVGRILVTIFGNPWRSLVRFDVGDIARLAGGSPCPCGCSGGLELASIEGRTMSLTTGAGGAAVTQGAIDRALAGVEGLIDYDLVQRSAARYHVRIVSEERPPAIVARECAEALERLYGEGAVVETESAEAISPAPPGKYLRAMSIEPIDSVRFLDGRFAPRDL